MNEDSNECSVEWGYRRSLFFRGGDTDPHGVKYVEVKPDGTLVFQAGPDGIHTFHIRKDDRYALALLALR
jgi:hypothetical protein